MNPMIKRFVVYLSVIALVIGAIPQDTAAVNGPVFKFLSSAKSLKQGETLRLDLLVTKPLEQCQVRFAKKNYEVFLNRKPPKDDFYVYTTFLGIPSSLSPGVYTINYTMRLGPTTKFERSIKVKVVDANFKKTRISMPPKKKALSKNRKQLSNEASIIGYRFKTLSHEPQFKQAFLRPAPGKVSSPFGNSRVYDNEKRARKHNGVDIANVEGTRIRASNAGKVILARLFKSHGNTVMIDHGWGVVTIYNHMKRLAVKKGDIVKRGQSIGEMGSTGIATGPHLHWGMSVQNTRVNPEYWVNTPRLTQL